VREVCEEDRRVVAALMYGSFVNDEGDAWSDIEFLLYFADAERDHVDRRVWIERVGPIELHFVNEFGVDTAIFDGLIRAEFHFDRAADIQNIDPSWREYDWFPSMERAIVLDRTGVLRRQLSAVIGPPLRRRSRAREEEVAHGLVNWILFGWSVLGRGERVRAHALLAHVHRYLLWLARQSEEVDVHWPTPSRSAEEDLSWRSLRRLAACTATLDGASLTDAYRNSWSWGKELVERLSGSDPLWRSSLIEQMDRRFAAEAGARA